VLCQATDTRSPQLSWTPSSRSGFHGLVGFDIDGDGQADVSTYIVGPNDALPEVAQINGAACHGIVPIEDLFPGGACFSG
jgi:hypothetical protein